MKLKELIEIIDAGNSKLPEQFRNEITYNLLLHTDEWEECRNKILMRDNYCCTNCNATWNPANIAITTKKPIKYLIKGEWVNEIEYLKWLKLNENKPKISLQVHHKYYQIDKLPWEYPDETLETLCVECHQEKHKNNVIPVYDEDMKISIGFNTCDRCFGTGFIYEFRHIQNGICFECRGEKYNEPLVRFKIENNKKRFDT